MRHRLLTLILKLIIPAMIPGSYAFAQEHQEHWQPYTDGDYRVSLRYPSEWRTVSGYYGPRFEGENGFFMLSAASDGTPLQMCQEEANNHLQPYGTHPTIRSTKVQGQKACLVWPSNDQIRPRTAELVIESPQPLELYGDRYSLLVCTLTRAISLKSWLL